MLVVLKRVHAFEIPDLMTPLAYLSLTLNSFFLRFLAQKRNKKEVEIAMAGGVFGNSTICQFSIFGIRPRFVVGKLAFRAQRGF